MCWVEAAVGSSGAAGEDGFIKQERSSPEKRDPERVPPRGRGLEFNVAFFTPLHLRETRVRKPGKEEGERKKERR